MTTKQIIIPIEDDTRIDISRITPETQGIVLAKNAENECIGFISYDGDSQQWRFYNEGDTAISAESEDTLLNCVTTIINSYGATHFDLMEFA